MKAGSELRVTKKNYRNEMSILTIFFQISKRINPILPNNMKTNVKILIDGSNLSIFKSQAFLLTKSTSFEIRNFNIIVFQLKQSFQDIEIFIFPFFFFCKNRDSLSHEFSQTQVCRIKVMELLPLLHIGALNVRFLALLYIHHHSFENC